MTVELSRQGAEFFWAALTGLGLGLIYDLERALRREHEKLTVPADGLFALLFFLALALTAVYTRGLRLYQGLGIFLGAGLWFLTLSPRFVVLCRRGIRRMARGLGAIRRGAKKTVCFLRKTAKKLFPFEGKWSTI